MVCINIFIDYISDINIQWEEILQIPIKVGLKHVNASYQLHQLQSQHGIQSLCMTYLISCYAICICISLLIILPVGFIVCQNLELEASVTNALEGDDISIRCTIIDYDADYFITWKRQTRNETVHIGTNNWITGDNGMDTISRYSIRSGSASDVNATKSYILDIRGKIHELW